MQSPMPGLSPRPYTIEEYTRAVCPKCAEAGLRSDAPDAFLDAMLVSHSGSIWLRRTCPRHGVTESLYEEDADIWRSRFGWQTPTLEVVPDRHDNHVGFPHGYREGLPSTHGQHSCILLLNIAENCNLACPTCYASALEPGAALVERPTFDEILHTVDTVIEREGGRISVLMLSGGEPTLRTDLERILDALAQRPITRVMLNTNGRRIARDPKLAALLGRHRDKVEVYLQFDGLEESTHTALRGVDLMKEKEEALAALSHHRVFTTLVMAVKRGVNEHEVGAVFEHGKATPYCSGIAFQPVFGSGRESGIDPVSRATPTGVIKALGKAADFVPLPCSHRDCCDIAYFLKDKKGVWRSLVDVVGRQELKRWIGLASNTISFEDVRDSVKGMIKDGTLQRLLSEQQRATSLQVAWDLARACDCVPGVKDLFTSLWPAKAQPDLEALATHTFRVTVKMFMDAHTFHEHRIRQCCVHVGSYEEDPRRTPFCWRWLFADSTDFPKRESTLRMV